MDKYVEILILPSVFQHPIIGKGGKEKPQAVDKLLVHKPVDKVDNY